MEGSGRWGRQRPSFRSPRMCLKRELCLNQLQPWFRSPMSPVAWRRKQQLRWEQPQLWFRSLRIPVALRRKRQLRREQPQPWFRSPSILMVRPKQKLPW